MRGGRRCRRGNAAPIGARVLAGRCHTRFCRGCRRAPCCTHLPGACLAVKVVVLEALQQRGKGASGLGVLREAVQHPNLGNTPSFLLWCVSTRKHPHACRAPPECTMNLLASEAPCAPAGCGTPTARRRWSAAHPAGASLPPPPPPLLHSVLSVPWPPPGLPSSTAKALLAPQWGSPAVLLARRPVQ